MLSLGEQLDYHNNRPEAEKDDAHSAEQQPWTH